MRLISLSSATLGAVISLQSARSTDHALEQGAALARAAKRRRGAWTSVAEVLGVAGAMDRIKEAVFA